MPTPFENQGGNWGARPEGARRSVFPNYPAAEEVSETGAGESVDGPGPDSLTPEEVRQQGELALARSFVCRVLAAAYADPNPETWDWLSSEPARASWERAWRVAGGGDAEPVRFDREDFGSYRDAYVAAFGHAARGLCPINEIEYGLPHADPLFHPHRLADLAGFYRAFGMELSEEADERPDHLSVELEFLCILAAKECWNWMRSGDGEALRVLRDAQRRFLREHMAVWVPAFARRLERLTSDVTLRGVARCTHAFVLAECRRWGVPPGSDELGLRPVNDALERLCATCGLAAALPGAGSPPS